MAEQTPQTRANHAQTVPGFHYFVLGVLAVNIVVTVVALVKAPGFFTAWAVVLAFGLAGLSWYVRSFPLGVQDRLIRLEEQLRLARLLPEPLKARVPELTTGQLIALRFASDAELPAVVDQTLAGNLPRAEIKKRIKEWRPDYLRI